MSSLVTAGHVGLSAAVPVWQRLGHEVISLPTILLSEHPDHKVFAAQAIEPDLLRRLLRALDDNGTLTGIDLISTGYLPTAEHVAVAQSAVHLVRERSPQALYHCDPVFGDDPDGLYIAEVAAVAVRNLLVPLADVLTPNAFELYWLTGRPISSADDAAKAARERLPSGAITVTTSVTAPGNKLANVLTGPNGDDVRAVARLAGVPHGTGDVLSALFLAQLLIDQSASSALEVAVQGVSAVISRSLDQQDLSLVASLDDIARIVAQTDRRHE